MKLTHKLIVVVLAISALACLSGCSGNIYSNADKYTSGDREIDEKIEQIDIDWSSGSVNVSRYDGSCVSIKETCSDDLKESKRVHSWVDGKVLRIKFGKSGEMFMFSSPDKKLEVRIPKDMELTDVKLDGSSCDSEIKDIEADHIYVDISTGDVEVIDCKAKSIDADSSSGDVYISQQGSSDTISADTSSGEVEIKAEKVKKMNVDTSSGKVTADVQQAERVDVDTSSGNVELTFSSVPSDLSVDTSSGDVTVYVPKDPDLEVEIDTASGDFYSEPSCSRDDDTYTYGSGGNKFDIDTSSGDIKIKIKD